MSTQINDRYIWDSKAGPKRTKAQSDLAIEADRNPDGRPMLEIARELYAQRRLRDRMFNGIVPLGEPGWDMLLDLFIAHQEGRAIRITSACIGSGAPPTTALRMLGQLEQSALVERHPELNDRRSNLVTLTPHAITLVIDFLSAISAPRQS